MTNFFTEYYPITSFTGLHGTECKFCTAEYTVHTFTNSVNKLNGLLPLEACKIKGNDQGLRNPFSYNLSIWISFFAANANKINFILSFFWIYRK